MVNIANIGLSGFSFVLLLRHFGGYSGGPWTSDMYMLKCSPPCFPTFLGLIYRKVVLFSVGFRPVPPLFLISGANAKHVSVVKVSRRGIVRSVPP